MAEENANNESKNEGAAAVASQQSETAKNETAKSENNSAAEVSKTLAELKNAIAKNLESRASAEAEKKAEPAEKEGQNLAVIGGKIAQLEAQLQAAEVQLEALRSGLKTQYLEDAVILASAKKQKGTVEYKTIFAELKSKYPAWFGENGEGAPAGQKGTGSAVKAGTVAEKTDGIGARLAKRQKAQQTRSFWKN